eukprot:CAMPEP_0198137874 /NCGR_PEP_ID=MMETSP1443-20131203/1313_1 /TAXON_ID=186043 /ORGANISM="Entomoneis sp., Strain CCMP2396" /LENGTH=404 /DNA_ID=CAMNT_0043799439 /DNA_START=42 /DNA_END=1259 /DNA_ORIENTATION=+
MSDPDRGDDDEENYVAEKFANEEEEEDEGNDDGSDSDDDGDDGKKEEEGGDHYDESRFSENKSAPPFHDKYEGGGGRGGGYRDDPHAGSGNAGDVEMVTQQQQHDQLPSPEEVKANVMVRNRSRTTSKWCDLTTCGLLCLLIVMVLVFVVSMVAIPGFMFNDDSGNGSNNGNGNTNQMTSGNSGTTTPTQQATEAPTYSVIEALLINNDIALHNGAEFGNPDTYQSNALRYMEDTPAYLNYDFDRLQQAYALLCFYYRTNAEQTWHASLKWAQDVDSTLTNYYSTDNYCTWTGVTCIMQNDELVTKLDLSGGGLKGILIPELKLLSLSLTDLLLDDNPNLMGDIPAFLGEMSLKTLTLTDCGFTGNMPGSICSLEQQTDYFDLDIDCDKVFCQQECCDFCTRRE